MTQVTALLHAVHQGEPDALGRLYALLYPELRRLARSRMRKSGEVALLDTTSLVHEAYLRFDKLEALPLTDRGHFLAYASRVMRSVVVDWVRAGQAERRGGGMVQVGLDEADGVATEASRSGGEVLRLHDALEQLAAIAPRLVSVVDMRYFAGLSEAETAEALGVSVRTVARDWEKARIFLRECLG